MSIDHISLYFRFRHPLECYLLIVSFSSSALFSSVCCKYALTITINTHRETIVFTSQTVYTVHCTLPWSIYIIRCPFVPILYTSKIHVVVHAIKLTTAYNFNIETVTHTKIVTFRLSFIKFHVISCFLLLIFVCVIRILSRIVLICIYVYTLHTPELV